VARRTRQDIPVTSADLTPAWFSQVLAPRFTGARVIGVGCSVIGEGVGFVGEVVRVALDWDLDDDALPATVIVKLPSRHPKNRALAEGLMAYEREVRVYRDIGSELGTPMPILYHAAMDPTPVPWLERIILWLLLFVRTAGWLDVGPGWAA